MLQLTFTDGQVANFLEELGAFLEGHLAHLDDVSRSHSYKTKNENDGITSYAWIKR